MLDRAAAEPAACLGDIAAKARILVCDFGSAFSGFRPDELDPGERALLPFLREVGSLTQADPLPPAPLPASAEPHNAYARHRARLLAAYAEDRASRPIGGKAGFGTVEEAASAIVQRRCLKLAEKVADLPVQTFDDLAVIALATAILWEVNGPADPHEVAAVALIRAVLALTGTPLPPGFVGFGDEPDYEARDAALYAASGSLPAWAISNATAAADA